MLFIALPLKAEIEIRHMQQLNFPTFDFKIKSLEGKEHIFDSIRKKYVRLSPEEWVRQHVVQYLIQHKNFPESLIIVEAGLKLNTLHKRADILTYDKNGDPYLMVECKAPTVKITQDVFDQIARYNMAFNVKLLIVSNGVQHFCCEINYTQHTYKYLNDIPFFQ